MPKILTYSKRLILTVSFLGLIATNVLTLTHSAFNAAVSSLMGTAFGIQTVSDVLRNKVDVRNKTIKSRKLATRKFGSKVTRRTKKLVALPLPKYQAKQSPSWVSRYCLQPLLMK